MPASRTKAVVLWAFIYCSSLSSTCLAAAQSTSSSSSEEGDSSMLHEDSRCLCKCPDVSTIRTQREADLEEEGWLEPLPVTDGRSIYLNASVGPNECDCAHVVLIHLNLTETQVLTQAFFFWTSEKKTQGKKTQANFQKNSKKFFKNSQIRQLPPHVVASKIFSDENGDKNPVFSINRPFCF